MTYMYYLSLQVATQNNGFSSSFIYESAKDVLRWSNISVKENIQAIMSIGNYIFMADEDFKNLKLKMSDKKESMALDALDKLAKVYNGNDSN